MGDFSFRAVEVLQVGERRFSPKTRGTRAVCSTRYEIKTPMAAYHEHNEAKTTPGARRAARRRASRWRSCPTRERRSCPIPGRGSSRRAIAAGIPVVPIPGASALLAALVASGTRRRIGSRFSDSLHGPGGERRLVLDEIASLRHTAVLYEAPNRLADTLGELEQRGNGDRQAAVAREMTKQFEEVRRGTVSELRAYYEGQASSWGNRAGTGTAPRSVRRVTSTVRERVRALRAAGMSTRDVAAHGCRGARSSEAVGVSSSAGERSGGVERMIGLTVRLHAPSARSRSSDSSARVRLPPILTVARLQYDGGGDWYANPSSLPNLLAAIRQRTSLQVDKTEARVTLMDEKLWDYPVHPRHRPRQHQVQRLGGHRGFASICSAAAFCTSTTTTGSTKAFVARSSACFPDRPLVDVPLTHPIYHIVYDFPKGLPKIHEHDGLPARGFGIFLGDRLAVYYSFSSDLGNGWEDSEVYHDPPELHEAALRMGVNLFVYAVTSRPTP